MGKSFQLGCIVIVFSEIIFIIFILGIVLCGQCSATYFLEKEIYLKNLVAVLIITAIVEFAAQDLVEQNWVAF